VLSPHARNETTLKLLKDRGVDLDRFKMAYDFDFFKRNNLRAVTYFNKRKFGEDKVVKHPFCDYPWYVEGLLRLKLSHEEAVKQTPLSEKDKEQLLRVSTDRLQKIIIDNRQRGHYILCNAVLAKPVKHKYKY